MEPCHLSFSKGDGFGDHLLLAAMKSGRMVCSYLGCGDLESLHHILEEIQKAVRVVAVADNGNRLL